MTWSRLRSIRRLIMSSLGSQLYKVQSRTISSSFNNTINGRLILLVLVTFHQEISWHYFILCWKVHCRKNYLILVANTNIFNLRDHLNNCFSSSIKKCLPTSKCPLLFPSLHVEGHWVQNATVKWMGCDGYILPPTSLNNCPPLSSASYLLDGFYV